MRFPRHRVTTAAHEEIEVCSGVRLLHVTDVQVDVAAGLGWRWRPPLRASPRELVIGNVEVKTARVDVYTLSLHDALPIGRASCRERV